MDNNPRDRPAETRRCEGAATGTMGMYTLRKLKRQMRHVRPAPNVQTVTVTRDVIRAGALRLTEDEVRVIHSFRKAKARKHAFRVCREALLQLNPEEHVGALYELIFDCEDRVGRRIIDR